MESILILIFLYRQLQMNIFEVPHSFWNLLNKNDKKLYYALKYNQLTGMHN